MISYDRATMNNLRGDTPKEKYDSLILLKIICAQIAYPRRGTDEETFDIQHFADVLQEHFSVDDLKEN